jgi:hypothetical protein
LITTATSSCTSSEASLADIKKDSIAVFFFAQFAQASGNQYFYVILQHPERGKVGPPAGGGVAPPHLHAIAPHGQRR